MSDAKNKLIDGENEIAEKKLELGDAEKQLEDFIVYDSWTVQKRADNPGYASAQKCAVSSTKLCFSMAILFVFVGLMVCYTSVSRNVHESQVATGVQKALGFRKREIVTHYMLYSVLALVSCKKSNSGENAQKPVCYTVTFHYNMGFEEDYSSASVESGKTAADKVPEMVRSSN